MANLMCSPQKLVFQVSKPKEDKKNACSRCIKEHFFNYSISLLIPGVNQVPKTILDILDSQPFFRVEKLPLVKLVDVEFIEAFVKKGRMYVLSDETCIDTSTCVSLLPTGILALNVTKDIYEELGIEGKPSQFCSKTRMKYVIHIDVTKSCFRPGKKNYDRLKWCFTDRLDLEFNFLVAWLPNDPAVCPSTIGSYFTSCGFKCEPGPYQRTKRIIDEFVVPVIEGGNVEESDSGCGYEAMYEWLGAVSCDCDFGSPDDFVNTLCQPEPNTSLPYGFVTKISGFHLPETIGTIMDKMKECMSQSTTIPWFSLTVHGFSDSPVSWNTREHGYYTNGDNIYTIVVFRNDIEWLYIALGTNDVVP